MWPDVSRRGLLGSYVAVQQAALARGKDGAAAAAAAAVSAGIECVLLLCYSIECVLLLQQAALARGKDGAAAAAAAAVSAGISMYMYL